MLTLKTCPLNKFGDTEISLETLTSEDKKPDMSICKKCNFSDTYQKEQSKICQCPNGMTKDTYTVLAYNYLLSTLGPTKQGFQKYVEKEF